MQNQRTSTMSTPNPLMPQGALQGASSTAKQKTVAMIFTIVALHVAVIVVVLMQGCKREDSVNYSQMTDPDMQPKFDPDDGFHSPEDPPPTADSLGAGDAIGTSAAASPTATPIVAPRNARNTAAAAPTASAGADTSAPAASPTSTIPELPATPAGSVIPAPVTSRAATSAPESTAPPSMSEGTAYKIRSGDSFYRIAKQFGVSFRDIERANPSIDPNRLQIGQVVNIPGGPRAVAAAPAAPVATRSAEVAAVYTVQPGDNLTKIANRYRTTVNRIKSANGMRNDRIRIGQKLNIPAP